MPRTSAVAPLSGRKAPQPTGGPARQATKCAALPRSGGVVGGDVRTPVVTGNSTALDRDLPAKVSWFVTQSRRSFSASHFGLKTFKTHVPPDDKWVCRQRKSP